MKNDTSRRGFLAGAVAAPSLLAPPTTKTPTSGKLSYRMLGNTGLKVTTVGFGCMVTSDGSVIERAADMGINYFDTARVYSQGNNERMVGAALGARRKNVILSSKTKGETAAAAMKDLEISLRDLNTDYLDIWYLHAKDTAAQVTDELLEMQQQAKKAGKIRFAGVSLHNGHKEVVEACLAKKKTDVILITYNFAMDQAVMSPLLESITKAGVGTVAMKVMAGRFKMDRSYDYDKAKAVMGKTGAPLAALKFALKNTNINTTIPSTTDLEQLEENFRAMSEVFVPKDAQLLAAQLENIRPLYCRMCGGCQGTCPKGLPVSDMLRYLSYAEGYGQFSMARTEFASLPEKLTEVRCGDCASCAVQCPNGVHVPERLARAQELFG
jgi:uncharacterized protein